MRWLLKLAFLLSAGVAWSAFAAPSQPRAWVSGSGADNANCGPIASPCRSFQYAHDNIVSAGGSIYVKDPANYGQLTISKPFSIINDGGGLATIFAPSGDAIDVNVGPGDSVLIKGLTLDGAGTGANGVKVVAAGHIEIDDSTIKGFPGVAGINFAPNSGILVVRNDLITSNTDGLRIVPTGPVTASVLDSHFANSQSHAILSQGNVHLTFAGSAIESGATGIFVVTGVAYIDRSTITNQDADGIDVSNGLVYLSNSAVIGNFRSGSGYDISATNGALLCSFKNNEATSVFATTTLCNPY